MIRMVRDVTHRACREECWTDVPSLHTRVSGLYVIAPPQAQPAHPNSTGATTWMITSYAASPVAVAGRASR